MSEILTFNSWLYDGLLTVCWFVLKGGFEACFCYVTGTYAQGAYCWVLH